ncbi:transcriptional activator NhaR [bacterium (Candidatus Blackallbacteria) CG17_big_fil_post_rev_8_21_14_2_50_48_46]|uniref:Transcriptional activator NhaR n=1 Tax=bacterium (Candidatus Blackallbacteria) CG17_big_fil_post_rev_8_21_14_2_50_48_46 TaxID=2014261 RepID=A0A2M7G754_9BACT|nr:MAG: transcriptional activator NhaR [bacterium (Candidatus Blackallbacteria) CG18_big_fil_WC_8_21_14_2_50_49_26]PIW17875.1 MAG: transcriptional activator NhaR [bacterium (Candidatus Blackallbacteria) CG17_big_fil_post_rev_8_21_14_2_50_48_46]PIW48551.1 MAG: transcriptional activator NhaR [bacterium (Candidatus Blackallbacteria) CG13_big_fil_rev_8_21_14_2_50_49_14]
MNWLNYHHLYYFWMVAREGSITQACEKLHLSQPTVSTQLQSLEKSAGEKLFRRKGRFLVLTEMGQMVFRYADEIFSLGQELQQFLSGAASMERPLHLSIGITDSLPKLVSYGILEPLLNYATPVQFVCYEDDNLEGLLMRLSRFELDLVLADAPMSASSRIKAYNHLLGESAISFFAGESLAERYQVGFPHSLQAAPFLMPSQNTALRKILDQWLARHEIHPRIVAEFDDMALLKVFGQEGHGVFALPAVSEASLLKTPGLSVLGRDTSLKSSFYAISIERKIRNPAVAFLVERARSLLFESLM